MPYQAPAGYIFFTLPEELICSSPVDGGLEGTKDEDWVI